MVSEFGRYETTWRDRVFDATGARWWVWLALFGAIAGVAL